MSIYLSLWLILFIFLRLHRFEAEPLPETKYRAAPPRLSHCGAIQLWKHLSCSGDIKPSIADNLASHLSASSLLYIKPSSKTNSFEHERTPTVKPLYKCILSTYANQKRRQYLGSKTRSSLGIFDQAKVGVWTPFSVSITAMSVQLINYNSA